MRTTTHIDTTENLDELSVNEITLN